MTMQDLKALKTGNAFKSKGFPNPADQESMPPAPVAKSEAPAPTAHPAPQPPPTMPQLLHQPESALLVGRGPVRRAPRSGRTEQLNTKLTHGVAAEIRNRAQAHGGMVCIVLEDALAALTLLERMQSLAMAGDREAALSLLVPRPEP